MITLSFWQLILIVVFSGSLGATCALSGFVIGVNK